MNTRSMCSGLFRSGVIAGLLFAAAYTTTANAAQGCGFGYHQAFHNGVCVLNYPGPNATPAPFHPGCWRNGAGYLRCYR